METHAQSHLLLTGCAISNANLPCLGLPGTGNPALLAASPGACGKFSAPKSLGLWLNLDGVIEMHVRGSQGHIQEDEDFTSVLC